MKLQLTEKEQKALEVARELLALNPTCLLSGSLALKLYELPVRRELKDLDIYLPNELDPKEFKRPDGCKHWESNDIEGSDNDGQFEIYAYYYKGIVIDTFTAHDPTVTPDYTQSYDIQHGVRCLLPEIIMQFKIHHALDTSFSRFKHRNDIIHTFVNMS